MRKMQNTPKILVFLLLSCFAIQCKNEKKTDSKTPDKNKTSTVRSDSIDEDIDVLKERPQDVATPKGMVWISGGNFIQGAVPHDKMAMAHEKPAHRVAVDGFFMDITEVTNADFKKFVDETKYVTVAEREIDWEEMKKQLPEGTPKPHDSIMQPGSLTFKKSKNPVPNLYDFSQWWRWTIDANWKQPNGPGSTIKGKNSYPVVHIAYEDAVAYCEWAGRRLPTEAEWEWAARGNTPNTIYFWGEDLSVLSQMGNTWDGEFPVTNTQVDGFEGRAPVKTFPPNGYGLYDMAGNVWEWTSDWYNTNYYREMASDKSAVMNQKGAKTPFNERDSYAKEKVMKGGSFLCSESYCASYRISARMATSLDSSLEHLGFRTVATVEMVVN